MMKKRKKNEEWAPVDQYDDDQRYLNGRRPAEPQSKATGACDGELCVMVR